MGTGTASNFSLLNTTSQVLTVNATGANPGTINLQYLVLDDNGCLGSTTVTVTINPLPVLNVINVVCAPNLLTYEVNLTANGGNVTTSEGTLTSNGGNSFTVSAIPAGTNVSIALTNAVTGCQVNQTVTAPDCSCPSVAAPASGGDKEICNGDPIPMLLAAVGAGETVDWYNTLFGGVPFISDAPSFTPSGEGIFYAETRVTVSGCKSSTRTAVSLTINTNPIASPIDKAVCIGNEVTINGSPAGGSGVFSTHQWTDLLSGIASGYQIENAANQIVTIDATGATSGSVNLQYMVTDNNGCIGTKNVTVTINDLPACNITGVNTTCSNTMGLLFQAPDNLSFYSWNISGEGNIVGSSSTQNITVNATNSGSFNLSLTVLDNNGCSSTCSKEVTVNALPACEIVGASEVIAVSEDNFYTGTDNMVSYFWSISGNGIINGPSNQQIVNLEAGIPGSFLLTLSIENANGCISTCSRLIGVAESPVIGLAKALAEVANNHDGTYDVEYLLTVENFGDVPLTGLVVTDDIVGQFPGMGATGFSAVSGSLLANPGWDGQGVTNILAGGQGLAAGQSGTVVIRFTVTPGMTSSINNLATVEGISPANEHIIDSSNNGFDPDGIDNDNIPDEIDPTPTPFEESPGIGLAKTIMGIPQFMGNGAFELSYQILVKNTGNISLTSIQVIEDLSVTFNGALSFAVTDLSSAAFTVNPNFDGITLTNLLSGSDTLAAGETGTIELAITVTPGADIGPYLNLVTGMGTSPAGAIVQDFSQEGTDVDPDDPGDINPTDNNDPTPFEIPCIADAGNIVMTTLIDGGLHYDICQGGDLLDIQMINIQFTIDYSAIDELDPGPGYDRLILLANTNGTIVETATPPADFNFQLLPPGIYTVYSLSYYVNNPQSLDAYLLDINGDADLDDVAQIEADDVAAILCLDFDSGTPFTAPFTIEINAPPAAGPIVGPSNVCLNSAASLDGVPSGGSGIYTNHQWVDLGTGTASGYALMTPTSQELLLETAGATVGTIDLQYMVTDNNGCSATTQTTIAISPNPILEITGTNCSPSLLTYDIHLTTNGDNVFASSGPVTNNGGGVFTVSGISSGEDVIITVENGATGCVTSQSVMAPVCSCSPIAAPISDGDQAICSGDVIPALSVVVAPGITANWYSTPTGGSPLATGILSYTPATPGVYYVEAVEIVSGCTSSTRTAITLSEFPSPQAGPVSGLTGLCLGETISLQGNPQGGTAPLTHTWTITGGSGGANISNSNDGNLMLTGTSAGSIFLAYSLSDGNGCTSGNFATYTVTVHSLAMPSITLNGGLQNPTTCGGINGSITINGLNTGSVYFVNYTYNGAPMVFGPALATLNAVLIPDLQSGVYDNFILTDINTLCVSPEIPNGPFVLSDPGINTPTIDSADGVVHPTNCNGNDGAITISGLLAGLSYSINYTFNGFPLFFGPISANAFGEIILPNLLNGIYDDFLITNTNNNCSSGILNPGPVELLEPAPMDAPVLADFIEVCFGEDVHLEILNPNPVPLGASFIWTGENGFYSTANEPTIVSVSFADTGLYTVIMIVNGCPSAAATVGVIVGDPVPAPTIVTNSPLCIGDDLILKTSTICSSYIWVDPAGTSISTLSNPLLVTTTNMTTIPAVDSAYLAGGWGVICVDANGCRSGISAMKEVIMNPIPAIPIPTNSGPICEGESVQLFSGTTNPPDATYIWYDNDPNLTGTDSISSEYTPVLYGLPVTGFPQAFWLQVTVNGCLSEPVPTFVTVYPRPSLDPQNAMDDCGSELSLFANPNPPDSGNDYIYNWTGPNGIFMSDLANPVIPNLNPLDLVSYTVFITDQHGCISDAAFTQVDSMPQIPLPPLSLSSSGPMCEGEPLELFTAFYSGQTVSYVWTIMSDTTTSIVTTDPFLIIDSVAVGINDGFYYVEVIVDGCTSPPSALEFLDIVPSPSAPNIVDIVKLCEGDDLQLQTDFIVGATYLWTGPQGFTSNLYNPFIASVNLQQSGTYSVFITINGCTSPAASSAVVIGEMPDPAEAFNDSPVCEGEEITLYVNSPVVGATYEWFHEGTGIMVGAGSSILMTNVTMDDIGAYYVVISLSDCSYDPSLTNNLLSYTDVIIAQGEPLVAQAGADQVICDDFFVLTAEGLPQSEYTGNWTSINGNPSNIASPKDASTLITELEPGENIFSWSMENDICETFSSDTITLIYDTGPNAVDDNYTIGFGESLNGFDVMANDELLASSTIMAFSEPENGTLVQNADGTFTFIPADGFSGTVVFDYIICSDACPELCDVANVTILISADPDCPVPNVFTPNGDGLNDTFIIPCTEEYPGSTLLVFNRWGDEVYRSNDYRNDWAGTYREDLLPLGTYFYILTLNDKDKTVKDGYVYLQRS